MNNLLKSFLISLLLLPTSSIAAKKLIVGTSYFYPPFIMRGANNTIYGFDVDLMFKICKEIDIECQFKTMTFAKLPKALLTGEIDLAISSITITEERAKVINFSIPYMLSNGRLLVRKEIPTEVIRKNFLDYKRIGVLKGSVYIRFINSLSPKDVDMIYVNQQSELIDLLVDDKLDVALLDNPAALWWQVNSSGMTKVAGRPFPYGRGIAIAVGDKSKDFLVDINNAILKLQKNGYLPNLYKQYFALGMESESHSQ